MGKIVCIYMVTNQELDYSYASVRIVPGEARQCILSIESCIVGMGSVDSKESTQCLFYCSWRG